MRALLDGETVTSEPGGHYAFDHLVHHPRPVQDHLPIMIGGSGEKKTLRTVAKYADLWNAMGPLEVMALGLATGVAAILTLDGESHWFEGVQLLAVYAMAAVAAFFI